MDTKNSHPSSPTPYENFVNLTRNLVNVPKDEIDEKAKEEGEKSICPRTSSERVGTEDTLRIPDKFPIGETPTDDLP